MFYIFEFGLEIFLRLGSTKINEGSTKSRGFSNDLRKLDLVKITPERKKQQKYSLYTKILN